MPNRRRARATSGPQEMTSEHLWIVIEYGGGGGGGGDIEKDNQRY